MTGGVRMGVPGRAVAAEPDRLRTTLRRVPRPQLVRPSARLSLSCAPAV